MKLRSDIPLPSSATGYKKDWISVIKSASEGSSVHVRTKNEAISLYGSVLNYNEQNKTRIKVSRRTVDNSDPEGPGFRVWFLNMPDVWA